MNDGRLGRNPKHTKGRPRESRRQYVLTLHLASRACSARSKKLQRMRGNGFESLRFGQDALFQVLQVAFRNFFDASATLANQVVVMSVFVFNPFVGGEARINRHQADKLGPLKGFQGTVHRRQVKCSRDKFLGERRRADWSARRHQGFRSRQASGSGPETCGTQLLFQRDRALFHIRTYDITNANNLQILDQLRICE